MRQHLVRQLKRWSIDTRMCVVYETGKEAPLWATVVAIKNDFAAFAVRPNRRDKSVVLPISEAVAPAGDLHKAGQKQHKPGAFGGKAALQIRKERALLGEIS